MHFQSTFRMIFFFLPSFLPFHLKKKLLFLYSINYMHFQSTSPMNLFSSFLFNSDIRNCKKQVPLCVCVCCVCVLTAH